MTAINIRNKIGLSIVINSVEVTAGDIVRIVMPLVYNSVWTELEDLVLEGTVTFQVIDENAALRRFLRELESRRSVTEEEPTYGQSVESRSKLKSIPANQRVPEDRRLVSEDGFVYQWVPNSTKAPDGVDIILPDDLTTNVNGRWERIVTAGETYRVNDDVSSQVDGVEDTFTINLFQSYLATTMEVYRNGNKELQSTFMELSPTNGTVKLSRVPRTGEKIELRYVGVVE